VDIQVLDMSLGYNYVDLRKRLKLFSPDMIGISMMTFRYKETYGLIARIKRDFPALDIVAGGAHISLFGAKVIEDCPGIDFAIIGEGERAIADLVLGNDLDSIKGLARRKEGLAVEGIKAEFIADPDEIDFPRYNKFELDKSLNRGFTALPIVSSRGCPFECIYCPVKCSMGRVFRARTPENIMEELTYWHSKGYRRFSFADDNFTLEKQRVYRICELIKTSRMRDLRLSCDNGIRADCVDRDLLETMKEAGFYRIAVGVESGKDRILKILKKKESVETIKKVISDSIALDYEVNLFFLVGSPGETWEDLRDSFKIAQDNSRGISSFYNIIPVPYTELFERIRVNGEFLRQPGDYLNDYPVLDNAPVFETMQMPYKTRKMALRRAFALSRSTMRRVWFARLRGPAVLRMILAMIYSSSLMQDKLLRSKSFKIFLRGMGKGLLK
jgi:radical SAM superfamily enzyme YgiQ (UPF0313 family)